LRCSVLILLSLSPSKVCLPIRKHTFHLQASNQARLQHQRTLRTASTMFVLHVQRVILATLAMLPPQGSSSNNHWSAADNPPGGSQRGHALDPGSTCAIPFGFASPTSKTLSWPKCNINDRESVVAVTSQPTGSYSNATIHRLHSATRGIGDQVFKQPDESEVWSALYGTSVSPTNPSALDLSLTVHSFLVCTHLPSTLSCRLEARYGPPIVAPL
jgi:hypothetical protein